LPGVGAFRDAMASITPLKEELLKEVYSGKPLLGVCLGLQMLFDRSFEGGLFEGLKLIRGDAVKLPPGVKIPHMGWNTIRIVRENPLLDGVKDGAYVYFVHSYYVKPCEDNVIVAETDYGVKFPSIVSKGCLYGTQFHPEKSGKVGLKILKNFVSLVKR